MVNELYVTLSYPSAITPKNRGLFQDGVHLGLRYDALREPLAHPPPVISPFLQRFHRK